MTAILDPFSIRAASINGTQYGGTTGVAAGIDLGEQSAASDGAIHETIHTSSRVLHTADLELLQVGTMLDAMTCDDSPVLALDATDGLLMVAAKAASTGPGYAAGSVHETITFLRGLLYATGLSWSRGSFASLALRALAISTDGDAAPFTAAAAAIDSEVENDELWDLSALTIASIATNGVQGVVGLQATFEPNATPLWLTGKLHPTLVTCAGVNGPVRHRLSFDTTDLALARAIGQGVVQNVSAVFKQASQQAPGWGSDTLTLAYVNCWIIPRQRARLQPGSPGMASFEVLPRYDGTTKPLTITVS